MFKFLVSLTQIRESDLIKLSSFFYKEIAYELNTVTNWVLHFEFTDLFFVSPTKEKGFIYVLKIQSLSMKKYHNNIWLGSPIASLLLLHNINTETNARLARNVYFYYK